MDPAAGTFDSAGVRIGYDDVGEGPPVILLHGFASDRTTNWRRPGWYRKLADAGRRVIAPDFRGHGDSSKPHDPSAYGREAMVEDVVGLLDRLSLPTVDVFGYSMGAQVAAQLLVDHPDRVNAVVLGGADASVLRDAPNQEPIAEALESTDPDAIDHPAGRWFRAFAERQGGDPAALAAAMRAFSRFDLDRLAAVDTPVLVAAGGDDRIAEDPERLASVLPLGESLVIADRDHMTTVGDPELQDAVVDFLDRRGLRQSAEP